MKMRVGYRYVFVRLEHIGGLLGKAHPMQNSVSSTRMGTPGRAFLQLTQVDTNEKKIWEKEI
jgi:hypothetical protein